MAGTTECRSQALSPRTRSGLERVGEARCPQASGPRAQPQPCWPLYQRTDVSGVCALLQDGKINIEEEPSGDASGGESGEEEEEENFVCIYMHYKTINNDNSLQ